MKTKWYSGSVLMKSIHEGTTSNRSLWEESIVLVTAKDESEALGKLEEYGKKCESSYISSTSVNVSWVFDSIERIQNVEFSESEPTEVFSRFLRDSEVESLKTPFED